MEKNSLLWIIFFVFVLIILSYGNIKLDSVKEIKHYDIEIVVGGLNDVVADENKITFYSLPGKSISGNIGISDEEARKVRIFKEGEVVQWLEIEKNRFDIKSNEVYDVNFVLNIPYEAEHGNYSLKLRLELV